MGAEPDRFIPGSAPVKVESSWVRLQDSLPTLFVFARVKRVPDWFCCKAKTLLLCVRGWKDDSSTHWPSKHLDPSTPLSNPSLPSIYVCWSLTLICLNGLKTKEGEILTSNFSTKDYDLLLQTQKWKIIPMQGVSLFQSKIPQFTDTFIFWFTLMGSTCIKLHK